MPVRIAVVGDRDPSYLTHRELDAALALMPPGVEARWVATDGPEASRLDGFDALWVVPGTPYRDDRPVFAGIEHARTRGIPILGTCGGFQHMVVEFARNAAGIADAAHAETAPEAGVHAVSPLACSLVGEVRQVTTVPKTRVAALCGPGPFPGFHWCSYGLEPACSTASSRPGWSSRRPRPTPASSPSSCPTTPSMWRRSSSRRWGRPRPGSCIR
jgi:hypothetical protein